ncbi:MAG TPA: SUMF1/EgtB/PvdO family nonheme iron enzyme [Bacteroidales bacterium]|nr:SUMF1/EgtB/PvdO family nonheme iron enzyme [Bacteroidales bacterium]HPZ04118.1 SUMF1/EgtB/PvdO family nonheme iron enzyme [Bacteroidales bacterium]HQB75776.1 SUMF1/EgtB/PvdO family nonheme iron enzyme [Bacteroidales bacterium]
MKSRVRTIVSFILFFFLLKGLSGQDSLFVIPVKNLKIEMICVNGGVFTRGCNSDSLNDKDCPPQNRPKHQVYVDPFYISKYEVTRELYLAVMKNDPAYFRYSMQSPIESLDWYDVQRFIDTLRKITGLPFRLPTEAEWEYAARGGVNQDLYRYAGSDSLDEVKWHRMNTSLNNAYGYSIRNIYGNTMPIGQKKPNSLGIYDMSGNVAEWCSDWYSDSYYQTDTFFVNPQGPESGDTKIVRGGNWGQVEYYSRVSSKRKLVQKGSPCKYIWVGIRLVISY